MTQYLPPNLLALFAPREPIPYLQPLDKLPHEKKLRPYYGISGFLQEFEDPKDTPPPTRVETKDERKERKRKERAEQVAYQLEQDLALWDPANDPMIPGDPYKTLFVARVNYDTSESKLRREFEAYGPVKSIRLVSNKKDGKMRGYAFVEYEHERDMHSAYKHADGRKIDGRRVLVDIERGRTIKGWRPRRLGGGLGGTRKGGPDVNTKFSGRDDGTGNMGRDDRSASREREMDRERGGAGGGGRRRRSRSRERRRRSRSPRDRRRRRTPSPRMDRRDREPMRMEEEERKMAPPMPDGEPEDIKPDLGDRADRDRKRRRSRSRERRRSRSRDRDRKRRRSRERRRSRSPRDRRDRDRGENGNGEPGYEDVTIKAERLDVGYQAAEMGYNASYIKQDGEPPYMDNPQGGPPMPPMGMNHEEMNEYGTYGAPGAN